MFKRILTVLFVVALSLCIFHAMVVRAERASEQEMEQVCQNWLAYMVNQRGAWAGETYPQIIGVDEIIENDTVLARCFSISPRGYVVVPILKELPPIKAYSEEYGLNVNQRVGFPQLLREVLLNRVRLYAEKYGSLDAVQPPTGDVLLGRGHRGEWNHFLKSKQEFETDLIQGKLSSLTEVGPLLTTAWHQEAPYNKFCPMGYSECEDCGGSEPVFPSYVGCTATAMAQILKYWNWPPYGCGSKGYSFKDISCYPHKSSDIWVSADFSDTYDWDNMPDDCLPPCTPTQEDALAELCYEVGVALNMEYGVCGSSTYLKDSTKHMAAYHTYFRYKSTIDKENRKDHSPGGWFNIITTEINNDRPIHYFIYGHSLVCDGWRDTGGSLQYHMNYGWGGPHNFWYDLDECYGCDDEHDFMFRYIEPSYGGFCHRKTYQAGDRPIDVFPADVDGDGDFDLAVANQSSANISILKNNGMCQFPDKDDYGVGGNDPWSVFCGDVDNDGHLDVVVALHEDDSVCVLKNDGTGQFPIRKNYYVGNTPTSVFLADLDGDDDLDIAVSNYDDSQVAILKNDGTGDFLPAVGYNAGSYPNSIFCADLDDDGDQDVIVPNYGVNTVSLLWNNGNGEFPTKTGYGVYSNPRSVFCIDIELDWDLDLVVACRTGHISILKNNGSGIFPESHTEWGGSEPWSVFASGLDDDVDFDLAVANYISGGTVTVRENYGDGTFTSEFTYGAGPYPSSVFCVDLDGDSDHDIVVANNATGSTVISVLENLVDVYTNWPPWPFSLLQPPDGSYAPDVVYFDWDTPYDPNLGDQVKYDLYVSTDPGFDPGLTTIYENLHISRFTANLDTGTYYWKVKAYDKWTSRWSQQTWSFTCGTDFVSLSNPTYVLSVSNSGNLAHQIDTAGFYLYQDPNEPNLLFDGSPIIGFISPENDTLVGRYIYDDYCLVPATDLSVDTSLQLKTIVVEKEFWPVSIQIPPADQYWPYWKIRDQLYIFYSEAPDNNNEQYIALEYIDLFHDEPPYWWPPLSPPSTIPDAYIGMALDINCPSNSDAVNYPFYDQSRRLGFLQGYGGINEIYRMGIAQRDTCFWVGDHYCCWPDPDALPHQKDEPYSMQILRNDAFVEPEGGFRDDSLYKYMSTAGYSIYGSGDSSDYNIVTSGARIDSHSYPSSDTFSVAYALVVSDEFGVEPLETRVDMINCGDANRDGTVTIADVAYITSYLFKEGPEPWFFMSDANGSGDITIADAVYLVSYLFQGGDPPQCSTLR